ncbi:hypothetical protein [Devosia alba]|uniref:hypothetical protein n=1 Tax=Devosia alba TaxID=3152360 RepID=UPI003266BF64
MSSTIIASRVLTLSDFGTISLLLAAATFVAAVLDFGSTIYVRKHSRTFLMGSRLRVRRALGATAIDIAARGLAVLLVLVMLALAVRAYPDKWLYVLVAPIGMGFAFELLLSETLRSRRWFVTAEFVAGGMRQSIYIVVLVIAAMTGLTIAPLATLYAAAMVLSTAAALTFGAKARLPPYFWRRVQISRPRVAERFRFFIVGALNILLNQTPLLLAGVMSSVETAGVVRVSLVFGMVMQLGVGSLAMYYSPRIGRGSLSEVQQVARQSSRIGLIGLPVAGIGIILVPPVIYMLFGSDFKEAVLGAQVLIATYGLISIFGAYGQIVLLRGGEWVAILSVIVSLCVTALLALVLVPHLPVTGYAMAYAGGLMTSYVIAALVGPRAVAVRPGPF